MEDNMICLSHLPEIAQAIAAIASFGSALFVYLKARDDRED